MSNRNDYIKEELSQLSKMIDDFNKDKGLVLKVFDIKVDINGDIFNLKLK